MKLKDLGTFSTHIRKGRVVEHNAITGGRCESEDRMVVKLIPSHRLNARVNNELNKQQIAL